MSLVQAIVNGILLGGLYACMGMGFSLIWGVMNIINLAQGSMMVLGAYITYFMTTELGVDPDPQTRALHLAILCEHGPPNGELGLAAPGSRPSPSSTTARPCRCTPRRWSWPTIGAPVTR